MMSLQGAPALGSWRNHTTLCSLYQYQLNSNCVEPVGEEGGSTES